MCVCELPEDSTEGQREERGAFRAQTPILSLLSCSTATLPAMFSVIRDGTSLHLARSSLLHLFLFSGTISPKAQTFQEAIPEPVVCAHIWKRCGVRCVILGFKQLSRHSYTTSEWGAAVSTPTATFLQRILDDVLQTNYAFVLLFCFGVSEAFTIVSEPAALSLCALAFCKYFNKLESWPDSD